MRQDEHVDYPLGPDETERLRALLDLNLPAGADDPALDALCAQARDSFGVATALVTLLEKTRQVFIGRSGMDQDETPRDMAFCNHTILADDVFVVPDAHEDPRFVQNPLVTGAPFIRFYAGAPLIYLRGIRLGAFCLLDPAPRQFSLGERAELAMLADEAVSLLVARMYDAGPAGT